MEVKIRQPMFVDEKVYFVNEKGRKYTHLGFDDIKHACYSSFIYRIGKKFNIVSRVFVQMHKHKDDYINSAIYDDVIEFPTFYVLFKNDNQQGIKIVEKNDKTKIFETGKLVYCETGKFAVVVDSETTSMYYSTDTTEHFSLPNFKTIFNSVTRHGKEINSTAYLFNFAGSLQKSSKQISSGKELENIMQFFRVILNEDVVNFNQPTEKFLLVDKAGNIVFDNLNKDINEYQIILKSASFDSVDQAEENVQNILNFYNTKMQLLIKQNKSKLDKLPTQIITES